MPAPPPKLESYTGQRLRKYLEDVQAWLARCRVVVSPGSGLTANETAGGTVLTVTAGGKIALIRTTASISARSTNTPGGGTSTNAVLVNWDGTHLSDGGTYPDGPAINVKNLTGGTVASGKYGFAFLVGGVYWLIAEC